MPLYEYLCSEHGLFQMLRGIDTASSEPCPLCGLQCVRVPSAPARTVIKTKEQLPYGTGSMGKYVSAKETGGLPIYVPSWGAMEQEEVDYVAEVAVEKERERVAKNRPLNEQNAMTKEALGNIVKIGKSQTRGKRAVTMGKVKKEGLR